MTWKIGFITQKTGLTARAVHFYEESGLIGPVDRTESGHRTYDRNNLLALQHIQTLKMLGFALSDIKPILEGDVITLKGSIEKLFYKIDQQRNTLALIAARLNKLSSLLLPDSGSEDDLDDVLFKLMDTVRMYESYFTAETIEELHSIENELGKEESENVEEKWSNWVASLQELISNGASPKGKKAKQVMLQWKQMLLQVSGGEKEKYNSISKVLNSEAQARADHGITEEMFDYLIKITGAREPF